MTLSPRVFWAFHAVLGVLVLLVGLEWFYYTRKRADMSRIVAEVFQIKEELWGCSPQDVISRMRGDLRQLDSAIKECREKLGALQRLEEQIKTYQSPALTLMEKVKGLEKGIRERYSGQPIPENLGFPEQLPENQRIVYLFYHLKVMERILPVLYAEGGYLSSVRISLAEEDRYPLELEMVLPTPALMDVYKELLRDPILPLDSEEIAPQDEGARLLLVKFRFLPYYDRGEEKEGGERDAVKVLD